MKFSIDKKGWGVKILFLLTLAFPLTVWASNSLLNQGSDLMKSLGTPTQSGSLSTDEIGAGLKEALKIGSENVVTQLGTTDGFNKDSNIHIPLPESLDTVKTILSKVGKSSLLDDLELKLNRAAEDSTPKAKQLFWDAISAMTL